MPLLSIGEVGRGPNLMQMAIVQMAHSITTVCNILIMLIIGILLDSRRGCVSEIFCNKIIFFKPAIIIQDIFLQLASGRDQSKECC
jgi:hypothetical protein